MSEILRPVLGRDVYIAPTSYVGGDVVIGDQSTVMHHVMIRGDIAPIRIGARVNVQDGAVLHTPHGTPLDIADDVGIGHRAIVHCRRIGTRTLIGMGAILLDDCEIGSRCVIAAGTLLPPKTIIPDGSVVMGAPGKIVREVTNRDLRAIDHVVQSYLELGRLHAAGRFPNIAPL
jgi:carbonic anhydrase/acetyltransferase-like protein (isoleucine patch superfamily)